MARFDRIGQNQERSDALGLKHISTSLKDSTQSNCAKRKGKELELVL